MSICLIGLIVGSCFGIFFSGKDSGTEHGFLVVEVYVDDGWSGLNFDRPDFNRMLDDIEAGKIDVVITKDLSRLGRDHLKVGHFTEIYFPMKNVRYIAVNDCVDTANKNNDKICNIRGYLLTTLYNAPVTINHHYRAEVQHDLDRYPRL